jgi:hypothetical protein
MTNIDNGIDDYSNTQLSKGSLREKPDWAERITRSRARFYQEGMSHGAELERERIIQLLDKNLGLLDWNDLVCLIKGDENGTDSTRS